MTGTKAPQQSIWFFYTVATVLGVSFSAVLLILAWNSTIENAERAFAFELVSFDETARAQARAADSVLQDFARLVAVRAPRGRDNLLRAVCSESLQDQPYIRGIAWFATAGPEQRLVYLDGCDAGRRAQFPPQLETRGADVHAADLRAILESDAVLPIALEAPVLAASEYAIARRIVRGGADGAQPDGVVILIVDAQKLLGTRAYESALPFEFLLESEGIGGRRLLVERTPSARESTGILKHLEQSRQIRFDHYNLRLKAQRAVGWRDLDTVLLLTALILSAGVTLLLIALARAKDLQARELAARNRVIEEQVRRQTYELALARDEALTASKVKSDFLASMSHEIRTPLNAIIGMAELLGDTPLSTEQVRYVDVFKNAGEALLSLVNDILDLSKIEAGQLVLEEIEFEPRELFEQAADIYALKTSAKGLELAVDVGSEVPPCLVGDPARIRQIVLNLIGNAVKFTEQGEILLSVRWATDDQGAACLRCSVQDSGIGIPVDKLEAIFGNFTQVDSSTTRKYGGTGLGLAICRRLVEMMGGRIWAESQVGVGSRFLFEVALKPGDPRGLQQVPMPDIAGRSILIIDDNATNRLILAQALGAAGARLAEAPSGREALRMVTAPRYAASGLDIVLCDSQMPEMDGFATITELIARGTPPGNILILTSSNLGEDVERAQRMGLGGYLVKPLKRKDLYGALGDMLRKREHVAVAPVAPSPADSEQRRILLVEDNADNRLLVRAYLKNEPYEIEEAENGAEAVLRFREKRFDLVLMDIQMPVMDGHEATRIIRAHEVEAGLAPMPIIALTAHAVKEEIDRSLLAGCSAHMTKPIKKKTLLDLLDQQLRPPANAAADVGAGAG